MASVRNSKTGELLYALDNALDDEFSPDSKLILIVSSDDVASVWNVKTGELLYALDNVWDSEFSPDSKFILTVSRSDGVASVRNSKTGELLYELDGMVYGFSPDGKFVLTVSNGVARILCVNWYKNLTLEQAQDLLLREKKQREARNRWLLLKKSLFIGGCMAFIAGIVGFGLLSLLNQ